MRGAFGKTYGTVARVEIGQILLSDNQEAISFITKELERSSAFNALCLYPPAPYTERQKETQYPKSFGQEEDLLCPFYSGKTLGCGIWEHRNAVCRSWHCMHTEGGRSLGMWNALRMLGSYFEKMLGEWCVHQQSPPSQAPIDLEEHLVWYKRCAQLAASITPAEAQSLHSSFSAEIVQAIQKYHGSLHQTMTAILRSAVTSFTFDDEEVTLVGYSQFAPVVTGRSIFLFLSKLDGVRTWREALAESNQEVAALNEELIVLLFKMDILCAYKENDFQLGFNLSFGDENQLQTTTVPISEIDLEIVSTLEEASESQSERDRSSH